MNGCMTVLFIFIAIMFISGGPFMLPGLLPLIIIALVWYAIRGAVGDQKRERQRTAMGFPPTPPEERPRAAGMPSGVQLVLGIAALASGIALIVWGITRL